MLGARASVVGETVRVVVAWAVQHVEGPIEVVVGQGPCPSSGRTASYHCGRSFLFGSLPCAEKVAIGENLDGASFHNSLLLPRNGAHGLEENWEQSLKKIGMCLNRVRRLRMV
jgi:hypothetical protein